MESFAVVNERLVANMRQIDRRQWRLWSAAILVTFRWLWGSLRSPCPPCSRKLITFMPSSSIMRFADFWVWCSSSTSISCMSKFSSIVFATSLRTDLYKMAVLDPVTNMFNRRYIMHRLEEEIARCQRHGTP